MANSVCEVLLTQERIDPPAVAADGASGALVEFSGVVRGLEDGREIEGIEYEAHPPMAEHQLRKIAATAAAEFALAKVTIYHRLGFVPAGEASLYLQVSSGHRAAAFEASTWIVDELKRKVPIWKRPRFKIAQRPAAETAATT